MSENNNNNKCIESKEDGYECNRDRECYSKYCEPSTKPSTSTETRKCKHDNNSYDGKSCNNDCDCGPDLKCVNFKDGNRCAMLLTRFKNRIINDQLQFNVPITEVYVNKTKVIN